jgi:predicted Fe-S protein YdhL (DUF1289 family)
MKIRRFKEKGFCIYCGEEKIHKAFSEEQLCSGCASDVIERAEWESRMECHKTKVSKDIMEKQEKIIKWASETNFPVHDVFDDMTDNLKVIKTFYADESPKDQSGMVLTLHDAELLAYEYARRLIEELNYIQSNNE